MNDKVLKEFDEKWNRASFCWNSANDNGVKFAEKTRKDVRKFLLEKTTEARSEVVSKLFNDIAAYIREVDPDDNDSHLRAIFNTLERAAKGEEPKV